MSPTTPRGGHSDSSRPAVGGSAAEGETPWQAEPTPEWEVLDPAVTRAAARSGEAADGSADEWGAADGRGSAEDRAVASERGAEGREPARAGVARGETEARPVPGTQPDGRSGARADGRSDDRSGGAAAASAQTPARPRALRLRQALALICVPLTLILAGIHTVASSWFLWAEYHRPGFPADAYGFDTEQRMAYGAHGLSYVTNLAPERFLADVRDAEGNPLFTAAEVGHMTDVKMVLLISTAAVCLLLILAVLSSLSLRRSAPGAVRRAVFAGCWVTLTVMIALGVAGALGWQQLFTGFHEVFFPQGNWAFRADDTLIRLYPPQFWVDAAATVLAVVVMLLSLLLIMTWPTAARRQRELAARHALQEETA